MANVKLGSTDPRQQAWLKNYNDQVDFNRNLTTWADNQTAMADARNIKTTPVYGGTPGKRLTPGYEDVYNNYYFGKNNIYRAPHPVDLATLSNSNGAFGKQFQRDANQIAQSKSAYQQLTPTAYGHYQSAKGQYNTAYGNAYGRGNPLAQQLEAVALGRMPTAAELQAKAQQQQLAQNIAMQAAMGMGGQYNPAVARMAIMQQSGLGQDMAGQTAANVANERLQALNQAQAIRQGGAAMQQNQQNYMLAADNQQYQQALERQKFLEQMYQRQLQEQYMPYNALLAREQIAAGAQIGQPINSFTNTLGAIMGGASGAVQAGGMMGAAALMPAASDRKLKKNIKDGKESTRAFLDALTSHEYSYKKSVAGSPIAPHGRHVSVMAQDLEKAGPIGKQMVIDTKIGKVVDYGKGLPGMLAALADVHKRVSKLEGGK